MKIWTQKDNNRQRVRLRANFFLTRCWSSLWKPQKSFFLSGPATKASEVISQDCIQVLSYSVSLILSNKRKILSTCLLDRATVRGTLYDTVSEQGYTSVSQIKVFFYGIPIFFFFYCIYLNTLWMYEFILQISHFHFFASLV